MQLLINLTEFAKYLKNIKTQIPQYLLLGDLTHLQKVISIPNDVFYFKGDASIPSRNTSKNELVDRLYNVLVHNGTETFNDAVNKVVISNQIDITNETLNELPNIISSAYNAITSKEECYSYAMAVLKSSNVTSRR